MRVVILAVRQLVLASPVAAGLGAHAFAAGAPSPAVFTGPPPADAPHPLVHIGQAGGTAFDAAGFVGVHARLAVRLYGNRDSPGGPLARMAEDLWSALHQAEIEPYLEGTPWGAWGVWADYPVPDADADGFPGYAVQVRVSVARNK